MEKAKISVRALFVAALTICLGLGSSAAMADARAQGNWTGLSGEVTSPFNSTVSKTDKDGKFTFRLSSKAQSIDLRTNDKGRLFSANQTIVDPRLIKDSGYDAKKIISDSNGKLTCVLFLGGKKTKTMQLSYGPDDLVIDTLQFSLNSRLKGFLREKKDGKEFSFKTNLVLPAMGLSVPITVTLSRSKNWPSDMFTKVAMKAPKVSGDFWLFTIHVTGIASLFAPSAIYTAYRADKRDTLIALVYAATKSGEGYIAK